MSMPFAEELPLKNRGGILEDRSGSSRPKPRFRRISSGSSSYRSSNSETLLKEVLATHNAPDSPQDYFFYKRGNSNNMKLIVQKVKS